MHGNACRPGPKPKAMVSTKKMIRSPKAEFCPNIFGCLFIAIYDARGRILQS